MHQGTKILGSQSPFVVPLNCAPAASATLHFSTALYLLSTPLLLLLLLLCCAAAAQAAIVYCGHTPLSVLASHQALLGSCTGSMTQR
jgi:hypothetical protein